MLFFDLLKRYGFTGSIKMFCSVLYSKIFFPQVKIIRLPFDIRNKQNVLIGKGFIAGRGCRIEAYPVINSNKKILHIGEHVEINDYVHITCSESVVISNNVLIASKVLITDLNHGNYSKSGGMQDHPDSEPGKRQLFTNPVFIDENVWIGESCCILPGSSIGKGSIIGAMSVVNNIIPPYSIAVGIPAKVVKQFNFDTGNWEKVN